MVAEAVADLLEGTGFEHEAVLAELEAAGYMEKARVDTDGDVWWDSTIQGNGLAIAKLRKADQQKNCRPPASRVGGTGAGPYNAAPDKPLFINTLRVFGS